MNQENLVISWWLLIGLNTLLALGPSFVDFLRRRLDLMNCRHVFLLFFWLTWCVWPAWVLLNGIDNFDHVKITFYDLNARYTGPAMAMAAGGLACFHAGYYAAPKMVLLAIRRLSRSSNLFLTPAIIKLAQPVYAFIGLFSGLVFIKLAGGQDYLRHIDEFRMTRLAGYGPLFLGLGFIAVAFFLAYYRAVSIPRNNRLYLLAFSLGITACTLALLCVYRHMFLLVIASGLLIHHYMVRRFKLSIIMCCMVILFMVFNLVYSDFRSTGSISIHGFSDVVWRGFFKRFIGLESFVRVRSAIDGGQSFLGPIPFLKDIVSSLMPRLLFPNKPQPLGWTANLEFYPDVFTRADTGSLPLGILGDFYWFGGIKAVMAGCALLGLLARSVYQIVVQQKFSALGLLLYSNFYVFFMFVAEDFKLHTVYTMHRLIFMVIPLVLTTFLLRPFVRHRLQSPMPSHE